MRKKKRSVFTEKFQQYDTSLKGWVKKQPAQIIPQLLLGATFVEALDIERIKPPMRVDRVFKILYRGTLHILHIEFESGADTNMPNRLLVYNVLLYYEYELPVISIIVYPFRTALAKSPLEIKSGDEELHRFSFRTLPLFTLEAEHYIQEHLTCMYPLLPAMDGANTEIIVQAMEELAALYREDETTLAQEFAWMEVLLERVTVIPLERVTVIPNEEKAKIGEKLKMYDSLWEEHPRVKKIKAEAKAEAKVAARAEVKAEIEAKSTAARAESERIRAESERVRAEFERVRAESDNARIKAEIGRIEAEAKIEAMRAEAEAKIKAIRAEAEVKAKFEAEAKERFEAEAKAERERTQKIRLQKAMVHVIKARFPALAEMVQQRAPQIESLDVLDFLLDQIEDIANESEARRLLRLPAA
ncbi:MAG: hypothetical protein ABI234_04085 [Ktedonobacteraceae bacterium]